MAEPERKRCGRCGQTKPRGAFHRNASRRDGLQSVCKECRRALDRERRRGPPATRPRARRARLEENREYVLAYLLAHPCVDCGERDPVVLEFDHVRGPTDRDISRLAWLGVKPERLFAEVAKCEVRCVNCHRVATAERAQTWMYLRTRPPGSGKTEPGA